MTGADAKLSPAIPVWDELGVPEDSTAEELDANVPHTATAEQVER